MTDGTTGIQVAPITEDDMSLVRSILQRATDAIIGMSQLSTDVDMLRETVTSMQADTERLRNQNNALDEALNYSRSERDRQASELGNVKADLAGVKAEGDAYKLENDKLTLSNEQYQIDLDLTRRERDDAQFQVLDLQERLAVAEGKLAKINEALGSIAAPVEAKPEPEPAPVQDPRPVQATAEPVAVDWNKPYHWDPVQGHYVNDPEPSPGDTHF